jgi:hypothetical protein
MTLDRSARQGPGSRSPWPRGVGLEIIGEITVFVHQGLIGQTIGDRPEGALSEPTGTSPRCAGRPEGEIGAGRRIPAQRLCLVEASSRSVRTLRGERLLPVSRRTIGRSGVAVVTHGDGSCISSGSVLTMNESE